MAFKLQKTPPTVQPQPTNNEKALYKSDIDEEKGIAIPLSYGTISLPSDSEKSGGDRKGTKRWAFFRDEAFVDVSIAFGKALMIVSALLLISVVLVFVFLG